ncbi:single-stranded-DNA-specific exonuclease RecJ [Paraphotobacterium marinum]|uniref:Single-stranded-DNA-specific exonuclease RecJ n=1 Tax=Paraphotobacterium marinum TaxID=1755811 RepID=A0A220VDK3_9GAMM|nr:single-stranded-DNA-specific exonuclease RecJ [Paraphotobacterium marinum]ASK78351.1 single-stranded-DNA-specific exonuclease RecJ [Paraphotobacterium marinum]
MIKITKRIVNTSESKLTKIDELLARIYLARGITNEQELELELNNLLSYHELKNIQKSTDLIIFAIKQNEKIVIVGDFDVDGATSTALAIKVLRNLGANVEYIIPHRIRDGYGLSESVVERVIQLSGKLIITVDNGISSIEAVNLARKNNIKVLITDHHLPSEALPEADAILNPNLSNCKFQSKNLCGVGVVFYLMLSVRAKLKELGYFDNKIRYPNLGSYLDLLALGTVADVVPLDYNNRILVHNGLNRIRAGKGSIGINALIEVSDKSFQDITASDLGYLIGPKLNAAGRLEDMSFGVELLICQDKFKAFELANKLSQLNQSRKSIEKKMIREAIEILQTYEEQNRVKKFIVLFNNNWHQGVSGILASRIKDKYHKPTIIFAEAEDGILKGSGRSIKGIHLKNLLDTINQMNSDIMVSYGGHEMAAGLSIKKDSYDQFCDLFDKTLNKQLFPESIFNKEIFTDGSLKENQITLKTANLLALSGPWGQSFVEPRFNDLFEIKDLKVLKDTHLKLELCLLDSHATIPAIAFNVPVEYFELKVGAIIHIVYKLNENKFRGDTSVQLLIDYITEPN